jgi:hypothetical protein
MNFYPQMTQIYTDKSPDLIAFGGGKPRSETS